jgi:hypothetical protein
MKQTNFFTTVILAVLAIFILPGLVSAQDFVGIYRIDIPGKASSNTTRERVDNQTVLRTDTITVGKGTSGTGTLEIKSDGTYALHDFIGYDKLKTGKWIINDEGSFSDKGGIELLEVKSANYGADQRSWYIFLNDDGEIEAREAPYTTYNSLRLTKIGGKKIVKDGKTKSKTKNNSHSDSEETDSQEQNVSSGEKKTSNFPSGKTRRWTVAEFRQYFEGKTQEEVEVALGKAESVDYKTWTYSGLQVVDPEAKNAVLTKAYLRFTEVKGGTVWHMTFF